MTTIKLTQNFRKYHRYLGFFLAGVMGLYACSGILLIFRSTDFLKSEVTEERQLAPGLTAEELGSQLRIKGFRVVDASHAVIVHSHGEYDSITGVATVTEKKYPKVVDKIVNMHKATTNSPLFFLNIAFGLSLLFFSISAFLMYLPTTPAFKNGLKIAGGGFVLALIVVVAA
jgi:hypothetical protein